MQKGNAAFEAGRLEEAAEVFQSAARLASSDAERAAALNNVAAAEESLGNFSQAERLYGECIRLWSQAPNAPPEVLARPLNNLAVLHRRRGQHKLALEFFERSLRLRPGDAGVLNNIGRLYYLERRYGTAEEFYRKALETEPGNLDVLANLAELEFETKRFAAAEETANLLLRTDGKHRLSVIALLVLGSVSVRRKAWNDADAYLRQAVAAAEEHLGLRHPLTACTWAEYAAVARKLRRKGEAQHYEELAMKVIAGRPERHSVSLAELAAERRR